MRLALLLLPCLLLALGLQAQTSTYRHSVGLGFERAGLDGPDAIGNRYLLRYARHLRNDRVALVANVGYMRVLNRVYLPGTNDYYVKGKRRQRGTTDVTAAYDVIGHPRHAFRLGAGPSLWYRQEELSNGISYTRVPDGSVVNVRAEWRQAKSFDFGYNVLLEYEYAVTDRLLLSGKVKLVDLGRSGGQSSIYGGGLGYRLR